jgi:hypothetical protein
MYVSDVKVAYPKYCRHGRDQMPQMEEEENICLHEIVPAKLTYMNVAVKCIHTLPLLKKMPSPVHE